jgi:hypothetical protein
VAADGALGHPEQRGRLRLAQAVEVEEIDDLALLVRQRLDLPIQGGQGSRQAGVGGRWVGAVRAGLLALPLRRAVGPPRQVEQQPAHALGRQAEEVRDRRGADLGQRLIELEGGFVGQVRGVHQGGTLLQAREALVQDDGGQAAQALVSAVDQFAARRLVPLPNTGQEPLQ